MNWKEFLKPDWRKVVITAILALIVLVCLINAPSIPRCPRGSSPGCDQAWEEADKRAFFMVPIYFLTAPFSVGPLNILTAFTPMLYLGFIIYWYLLSCVIVWVYDRVKKKS